MPKSDGTGPNGKGTRTGRGLGDCNPNKEIIKNNTEKERINNQSTNQAPLKRSLFGRGLGLNRRNSNGFRNRGR